MCVVDTGGRALTPSCSAKVAQGMTVETDNEKVRHSRKLVLELLGSSVDVDLAGPELPDGTIAAYMARYGADPVAVRSACAARRRRRARRPPRGPSPCHRRAPPRPRPSPSRSRSTTTCSSATTPRCILCYKCVEACGVDAQNTFAISVAGRGFDARVSTEYDVSAAGLRVRLVRQLHQRLPDGRADVQGRVRPADRRHVRRVRPDRDQHDLPVLRRGLHAPAARPGQHASSGCSRPRTPRSRPATCA